MFKVVGTTKYGGGYRVEFTCEKAVTLEYSFRALLPGEKYSTNWESQKTHNPNFTFQSCLVLQKKNCLSFVWETPFEPTTMQMIAKSFQFFHQRCKMFRNEDILCESLLAFSISRVFVNIQYNIYIFLVN